MYGDYGSTGKFGGILKKVQWVEVGRQVKSPLKDEEGTRDNGWQIETRTKRIMQEQEEREIRLREIVFLVG